MEIVFKCKIDPVMYINNIEMYQFSIEQIPIIIIHQCLSENYPTIRNVSFGAQKKIYKAIITTTNNNLYLPYINLTFV